MDREHSRSRDRNRSRSRERNSSRSKYRHRSRSKDRRSHSPRHRSKERERRERSHSREHRIRRYLAPKRMPIPTVAKKSLNTRPPSPKPSQMDLFESIPEVQPEVETAVFVKNYDYLWNGITCPDKVAVKLYSEELLSDVELAKVQALGATKYMKNGIILSSLKGGPPGTLSRFCGILQEGFPTLKHIATGLEKDLQLASHKQATEKLFAYTVPSEPISQHPIEVISTEMAPVLKKLIELVESEDDLTKYEKAIQESLQKQGCKVSVEIHCSKDNEGRHLQKMQLTCTLNEANIAITISKTTRKFGLVVAKIIDALHAYEGALERMKDCINQMHLLEPNCRLARIVSVSVQEAATVREFFHLLGKYWHWVDVDLLQIILEAAECEPALKMLSEFLGSRDSSLPVTEVIKEINQRQSAEIKKTDSVKVKARIEGDKLTLQEYSEKKAAICWTLELPREALVLSEVHPGSFIPTWRMSAELVNYVQAVRVSNTSLQFLARQSITEINIEGYYCLTVPPLSYWEKDASLDTKADNLFADHVISTEMLQILETTDEDSGSPLIMAAKYGHSNVVNFLLSRQATPNITNKRGKTALDAAVDHEHLEIIELLVAAGGTTGEQMVSELFVMCETGQLKELIDLISCGVSVESTDEETGERPLMVASRHGHTSVVELLLSKNANPNTVNKSGKTALDIAMEHEQWDILEILMKHDAMDGSGLIEMLINASQVGNFDGVMAQLQNGISVQSSDDFGKTPLLAASAHGHLKIVKLLLSHGADPNTADKNDQTALDAATTGRHWTVVSKLKEAGALTADVRRDLAMDLMQACFKGQTTTVQDLIKCGAPLNCVRKGVTVPALMVACQYGHVDIVQELVRAGANVDAQYMDQHACTALMLACQYGHTEVVRELIKAGAHLDLQNLDGHTGLIYTCLRGHPKVALELIRAGANVNIHDKHGLTALWHACRNGYIEVMQEMIRAGAGVNIQSKDGITALTKACENGHTEVVHEMIRAGASFNIQNQDGFTALMVACLNGHIETVHEMIRAGAGINLHTKDGFTALMLACQNGHTEVVRELITAGAEVNSQSKEGGTALMRACGNGHTEVVQELIRANANVNLSKRGGGTALMMACESDHTTIVHELIRAGANLDAEDEEGVTSLSCASLKGHEEVVQELTRAGANMEIQAGNLGFTALMTASQYGKTKVVQKLITAGAILDAQSKHGFTALATATKFGQIEVVKELIGAGANVDVHGSNSTETALCMACATGNSQMVEELLKAGASVDIQSTRENNFSLKIAIVLGHIQVVRQLLRAGADVNQHTERGVNVFLWALSVAGLDIVQELINAGAAVDGQIENTMKPLMLACYSGRLTVVQELIRAGANMNIQDEEGWVPLTLACRMGHQNIVKELITAGAPVDAKNKDGLTAWDIASSYGHHEICKEIDRHLQAVRHEVDAQKAGALHTAAMLLLVTIYDEFVKTLREQAEAIRRSFSVEQAPFQTILHGITVGAN